MPEIRQDELSVTPEEVRYLRRAFRRFALPYVAGMGVLSLVALWTLFPDKVLPSEAAPAAAGPATGVSERIDLLEERMGAILRHIEAVELELGGASKRVKALEGLVGGSKQADSGVGDKALASFKARLDKASRRIGELEASVAKAAAPRTSKASAASPADADVTAILGRVHNVEARQKKGEEGQRTFEQDLLDRMTKLEARRDQRTRENAALERSTLERLQNLEGRFESIERTLTAGELRGEAHPPAQSFP